MGFGMNDSMLFFSGWLSYLYHKFCGGENSSKNLLSYFTSILENTFGAPEIQGTFLLNSIVWRPLPRLHYY